MKNQTGLTLVEVLIAVVIVAILMTIGVPSFTNLIRDNQLTATNNDLVASIGRARSEAIENATAVTVCASSDGSSCSASDWDDGWLVFQDNNGDGSKDSGETVLDANEGSDALTIRGTATGSLASDHFTYANDGFLRSSGGLSLVLCGDRGAEEASAINLRGTGRPAQASDNDDDGIVETTTGKNASCP